MRTLKIGILFFLIGVINGCLPAKEETLTLSFWTDKEYANDGFDMIYANEIYVGELNKNLDSPICNDPDLVNFIINKSEDLQLTVQNEIGESIEIGIINLFSIARGIKIKPAENGEIYVDQSLDNVCTLVYLNWEI